MPAGCRAASEGFAPLILPGELAAARTRGTLAGALVMTDLRYSDAGSETDVRIAKSSSISGSGRLLTELATHFEPPAPKNAKH